MIEKQPSKEEIAKQREEFRKIALSNLKEPVVDVAAAYIVDNSKGAYGESINQSMANFKYTPALQGNLSYIDPKTGEEIKDLTQYLLKQSRENGKLYTGNITEGKIMKSCADIFKESVNSLKIQDLLDLTGSKKKAKGNLANIYVGDLEGKITKEMDSQLSPEQKQELQANQQFYKELLASYQEHLVSGKIAESLGESQKAISQGLEEILCEKEKPKESE